MKNLQAFRRERVALCEIINNIFYLVILKISQVNQDKLKVRSYVRVTLFEQRSKLDIFKPNDTYMYYRNDN